MLVSPVTHRGSPSKKTNRSWIIKASVLLFNKSLLLFLAKCELNDMCISGSSDPVASVRLAKASCGSMKTDENSVDYYSVKGKT